MVPARLTSPPHPPSPLYTLHCPLTTIALIPLLPFDAIWPPPFRPYGPRHFPWRHRPLLRRSPPFTPLFKAFDTPRPPPPSLVILLTDHHGIIFRLPTHSALPSDTVYIRGFGLMVACVLAPPPRHPMPIRLSCFHFTLARLSALSSAGLLYDFFASFPSPLTLTCQSTTWGFAPPSFALHLVALLPFSCRALSPFTARTLAPFTIPAGLREPAILCPHHGSTCFYVPSLGLTPAF